MNYSGDILRIASELGAQAELLLRGYAIITIERQKISALRTYPEIIGIELPKTVFISDELTSVCAVGVKAPGGFDLNGEGVIVGIVDSGIDYTHPAFINADSGTRIITIWDQTAEGEPPQGFTSGTEITGEQINTALRTDDPLSVLQQIERDGVQFVLVVHPAVPVGQRGEQGDQLLHCRLPPKKGGICIPEIGKGRRAIKARRPVV